nr:TetR/AcrR family transcriptional regulator [Streptomyces scabichelini]
MEDIAEATGLGKGSLYGAFGGKQELFHRVFDDYCACVVDAVSRQLGGDDATAYARLSATCTRWRRRLPQTPPTADVCWPRAPPSWPNTTRRWPSGRARPSRPCRRYWRATSQPVSAMAISPRTRIRESWPRWCSPYCAPLKRWARPEPARRR